MSPETRSLLLRIQKLEEQVKKLEEQITPLPTGWKRFEMLYRDDGVRVEMHRDPETGVFEFVAVGESDTNADLYNQQKYPTPRLAAENYRG